MKTTLTKLQKDVYKFASPSGIRPALHCVLFNGVRAVATDSFRLVETTKITTTDEAIPDTMIFSPSLKPIKVPKPLTSMDVDTEKKTAVANGITYALDILSDKFDTFPKYQSVKDDAEKRQYIEVVLSGDYLSEIAEYLARFQSNGAIKLRIPRDPKDKAAPVILEARSKTEHGYALLSPIRE